MHGIIHAELKKYVETRHGTDAWKTILGEAGVSSKMYLSVGAYSDEEVQAIVGAAATLTRTPAAEILEDFGRFISPTLMNMYRSLIKPEWRTMELLLNTEGTMHRVVRVKKPEAKPPRLNFEQTGPNTLRLSYDSPRRMCSMAKGIIKGVATHYGETVTIRECKRPDGSTEMQIDVT